MLQASARPLYSPIDRHSSAAPSNGTASEKFPPLTHSSKLLTATLSVTEIDSQMSQRGFKEMSRIWDHFKKLKIEPSSISESELHKLRAQHYSTTVVNPLVDTLLTVTVGSLSGAALYSLVGEFTSIPQMPPALGNAFQLWGIANFCFLTLCATTYIRRSLGSSLNRLLSLELASALSKPDFRSWHDGQFSAGITKVYCEKFKIQRWDDPTYKQKYSSSGEVIDDRSSSESQFVRAAAAEIIGKFNQTSRKHETGRLFTALKDGKNSINRIISAHSETLKDLREERFNPEASINFLLAIAAELKSPGTSDSGSESIAANRHLESVVTAIKTKSFLLPGQIVAKVWQRDPWEDLTKQSEFFCSAALRGNSLMERTTKGILAPFSYINNKSVSALDFYTSTGRIVRARIGAVLAKNKTGEFAPALFVDGVEGTSALSVKAVVAAIQDYASACGFKNLLFNAYPFNRMPAKVAHHVSKIAPLKEVDLKYFDSDSPVYLDARGLPIAPFEYSKGTGRVLAYSLCNNEELNKFSCPSHWAKTRETLRTTAIYTLPIQSIAFAATTGLYESPLALACLLTTAVTGFGVQLWYNRRGDRAKDIPKRT